MLRRSSGGFSFVSENKKKTRLEKFMRKLPRLKKTLENFKQFVVVTRSDRKSFKEDWVEFFD